MPSADLRELARAAERVALEAGLDDIAARLRENRAERDRPGTRVAIVGDFNRGKSTLANRLLGADLLPTGSVPLTKSFVLVRAIKDGPAVLEVRWPDRARELRSLTEDDPWRGLVLDDSAEAVRVGEGEAGPQEPQVLLSAPAPWLAELEVELIDTPGLNDGRVDHLLQTRRAVALSDVVVVAISAPSPLSLLEREFLAEELLTKRVPHVLVVLTKADQLRKAEVADFVEWFRATVAEVAPGIEVRLGPGLAPDGEAEVTALRDRIGDLAHAADVIGRRDRRLAWQLAEACAAVRAAAGAAIELLAKDEASRHEAIVAAKRQLDDDALRWNQLHLDLDERRLKFTEAMQGSVTDLSAELFETLDIELDRVSDVKAWWDRELPVRLRRELKGLTYSLESQIARTVSADLSWLADAVAANFAISQKPAAPARPLAVTVSEPQGLELDDVRRRQIIVRIVTAGGGIIGTAITVVSGFGMPVAFTIGGSAIAAIMAERKADAMANEQRAKVRDHLHVLIDEVVIQYRAALSGEVDRSYRAAFDDLRDAQASWRTARFEAIAATAGTGPDTSMWTDIRRRLDDIVGEFDHVLDQEET